MPRFGFRRSTRVFCDAGMVAALDPTGLERGPKFFSAAALATPTPAAAAASTGAAAASGAAPDAALLSAGSGAGGVCGAMIPDGAGGTTARVSAALLKIYKCKERSGTVDRVQARGASTPAALPLLGSITAGPCAAHRTITPSSARASSKSRPTCTSSSRRRSRPTPRVLKGGSSRPLARQARSLCRLFCLATACAQAWQLRRHLNSSLPRAAYPAGRQVQGLLQQCAQGACGGGQAPPSLPEVPLCSGQEAHGAVIKTTRASELSCWCAPAG